MKYRGIFEYEYPTEHKPPVSIDLHLHGDCVKGKIIEWEYRPLEQEPKWIPVSEKLPENHNQEVLMSLEWGIDIGRYSDGEWHSEWINHYDDGNVLAWMPLPQPYREVEE